MLGVFLLLGVGCAGKAVVSTDGSSVVSILPYEVRDSFFRVSGRQILDGAGNPVLLRGIAFGNNVWANPAFPPERHHDEKDYGWAKELGFTTIRFYLNYGIFESDLNPYEYKQSGFDWIDRNILWAKKHGLRLILNMHTPQGGFQSQGNGDALWTVKENQKRFTALWKEIARRYADEPYIIGFDLLNEPVVTESPSQWEQLANETVAAIRDVNRHHIIFIERMNANKAAGDNIWHPDQNGDMNFFIIPDNGVVYEFHFYEPMHFSHQGASWIPSLAGVRTSWPDPSRLEVAGPVTWKWATFKNPPLPPGNTGWTRLEGVAFKADNKEWHIGKLSLQCDGLGRGRVYVDDVQLVERNPSGEIVLEREWHFDEPESFYYWSDPVSGSGVWKQDAGRSGSGGWIMEGSRAAAVLSGESAIIRITQGNTYTVTGWMKGENVPEGAAARIRVDFHSADGEIRAWTRDYLESRIDRFKAFADKYGVPLYLGEFGTVVDSFSRGGAEWVSDVIDLCVERNISYNYHTWHEPAFGLFTSGAHLSTSLTTVNKALYALFTDKHQLKEDAITDKLNP